MAPTPPASIPAAVPPAPALGSEGPTLPAARKILARLLGEPIPMGEVARFFDSLSVLLRSGMLISEAVRRAGAAAGPEMCEIAEAVWRPMAAGVPLHRALEPFARRLPAIVLPVLE